MFPIRHRLRPVLQTLAPQQFYLQHASASRRHRAKSKSDQKNDEELESDGLPDNLLNLGIEAPVIRGFDKTIAQRPDGTKYVVNDRTNEKLAALKARIDQLDSEIQAMERDDPEIVAEASKFRRALATDLAVDLRHEIGDYADDEHEALLERARPPGRRRPGIRRNVAPGTRQPVKIVSSGAQLSSKSLLYYERLKRIAKNMEEKKNHADRSKELWRWYQLCKQSIPNFVKMIENSLWTSLWQPLLHDIQLSPETANRIVALYEDMLSSGKELDVHQLVKVIEALSSAGDDRRQRALDLWGSRTDALDPAEPDNWNFWRLGPLIYAASGHWEKAETLALQYLDVGSEQDVRILSPLIYAYAGSEKPEEAKRAMELYTFLNEASGGSLLPAEYESISTCFLNNNHTDYALAVFRDLMFSVDPRFKTSKQSPEPADGRIAHLVRRMRHHMGDTPADEQNDLRLSLPKTYQNKYFFASWLKQLISSGNLSESGAVVQMMIDRGIRPDARHLNGLVGAWLRRGDTESRQKAEQLAWSMVDSRINAVKEREGSNGKKGSPESQVPRATIETLCILAQHYLRRGSLSKVTELMETLAHCQLYPNTFFMNHVLSALQRADNFDGAWQYYHGMRDRGIEPDKATFIILWRCIRTQYQLSSRRASSKPPSSRRLFEDMLQSFPSTLTLDREDYMMILKCFSYAQDCAGQLLALHAFRDLSRIYPDGKASRVVVIQVMKSGSEGRQLSRLELSNNYQAVLKQMRGLGPRKQAALPNFGQDLSPQQQEAVRDGENNLWVLGQILKAAVKKEQGSDKAAARYCLVVAEEMGLGPMDVYNEN